MGGAAKVAKPAIPAFKLLSAYIQSIEPSPVTPMAIKIRFPTNRVDQIIASSGTRNDKPISGIHPKVICQAVMDNKSIGSRSWRRFTIIAPSAHTIPAPTDNALLKWFP